MVFFSPFEKEKCTACGECFHKCPVMRLPLDRAQAEIRRLLDGGKTQTVLSRCESCFTCDYVCPENAHPTSLILDRWRQDYESRGLPDRARYFMPHLAPNFRTYVIDRLPEDEKAMLRAWLDESPAEEIFYPGCNWITAPHLAKTSLLDGYQIRGSLAMCCGEMFFRMGLFEPLRQLAQRLSAWLGRMGVRRMVIPCTAGYNLFTNVLPQFGFDYKMEVKHLLPILLRRIETGEIEIKHQLDMTVTIQESCHAKAFGDQFMDVPRRILEKLGLKVIEEERSRGNMVCCGIGGGFSLPSSYNPWRLTTSTWRTLAEAKNTGADAIVTYCSGCSQMLATGKLTNPLHRLPIYHVVELIKLAIGEETISPAEKARRAVHFLAGVSRHQAPALLSGGRFRIEEIPVINPDRKY